MDRRDFVKGTAATLALMGTGLTLDVGEPEKDSPAGMPEGYRFVCLCCGAAEGELGGEHCTQQKYRTKRMHVSMFIPGGPKPEPWPEDEVYWGLDILAWLKGEGGNYLILKPGEYPPSLSALQRAHKALKKPGEIGMFAINRGKAAPGEYLAWSEIVPIERSDDEKLLAWNNQGRT
jgi:hypothetical protein